MAPRIGNGALFDHADGSSSIASKIRWLTWMSWSHGAVRHFA